MADDSIPDDTSDRTRPGRDSPEALAVSARLEALIDEELDAAGGWIPFARFMELALYAPGLGYYSAGAAKIGAHPGDGSDFVTAPELTPLFARALAVPIAEVLRSGGDTVLELGGGTGRLAADLLVALGRLGALPAHYLLLEVSADLRERQAGTLARLAPELARRVRWIESLPDRLHGVVLGNEVLDALPVELVVWDGSAWNQRGIVRSGRQLAYLDKPITDRLAALLAASIPDTRPLTPHYVSEVHPAARALVGALVSRLSDESVLFLIDYGFPVSEYYHPQRFTGTLMAHRRHRSSVDVLASPGLQDITAHVDFSGVADAARAAGGLPIGYTSQASFLIDCGIADLLRGTATDVSLWAPQAAALQTLLSEAEMGELFKVIAIGRHERSLTGFRQGDRLSRL